MCTLTGRSFGYRKKTAAFDLQSSCTVKEENRESRKGYPCLLTLARALCIPCGPSHLTVGCTWDVAFADRFCESLRALPPFEVVAVSEAGPGRAARVSGLPQGARGPADASRWVTCDGEHVYHVVGLEPGERACL